MEQDNEYYQLLGLERSATEREIKTTYRKRAMKLHPDKGGDAEAFKRLNEAYEVLSDEKKRKVYDQFGKEGLMRNSNPASHTRNDFEGIFGFRGMQMPLVYQATLSLEDMFHGKKLPIAIGGLKYDVEFEAGSEDGSQLMVRGYTDQKGIPRDILIQVHQKPDPNFIRKKSDLLIEIPISLREALFGFKRKIKNIDGELIHIQCTERVLEPDDVFVLQEKGMPFSHGAEMRRGRLFTKVKIEFPKKMWLNNARDKMKLNELLSGSESDFITKQNKGSDHSTKSGIVFDEFHYKTQSNHSIVSTNQTGLNSNDTSECIELKPSLRGMADFGKRSRPAFFSNIFEEDEAESSEGFDNFQNPFGHFFFR